MEEDEKESDEIELNVGGDGGAVRRRKKRRERTEQEGKIYTSSANFFWGGGQSCVKSEKKEEMRQAKCKGEKSKNRGLKAKKQIRGTIHVTG